MSLTFDEFGKANQERCEATSGYHTGVKEYGAATWALCLAEEAGEVMGAVLGATGQKKRKAHLTSKDVADELADLVAYADLLAHSLGIDLGAAVVDKWNRVSERIGYSGRLGPRTTEVKPERDATNTEFEKGKRQGLANAQWIAEVAIRDGRDVVEAIRTALIDAAPQPDATHVGVDPGGGERTFHRCLGCEWFINTTGLSEEVITKAVHEHLRLYHTAETPREPPRCPTCNTAVLPSGRCTLGHEVGPSVATPFTVEPMSKLEANSSDTTRGGTARERAHAIQHGPPPSHTFSYWGCKTGDGLQEDRAMVAGPDGWWHSDACNRITANEARHDAEIAKLREQVEMNGGHWHAAWEEARAREDALRAEVEQQRTYAKNWRAERDEARAEVQRERAISNDWRERLGASNQRERELHAKLENAEAALVRARSIILRLAAHVDDPSLAGDIGVLCSDAVDFLAPSTQETTR